MSAVSARLVAVPLGLLALLLRIAADVTLKPLTEGPRPGLGLLAWISAVAASVVIPLLVFQVVTYRVPEHPATLRLDTNRHRFVAPRAPAGAARWVILVMWVVSGQALIDDGLRTFLAATAFFLAVGIGMALIDRPWIALDPEGVTVQFALRWSRVRWDELDADSPQLTRWGHVHRLALVRPPDEDGHTAKPVRLPVDSVQIDDRFLAAVLRHYLENPVHRPAIGTPEELTRLSADLTAAADPAPRSG